jgi:hypothetical protein
VGSGGGVGGETSPIFQVNSKGGTRGQKGERGQPGQCRGPNYISTSNTEIASKNEAFL